MKQLPFSLLLLLIAFQANAQTTRARELGIRFSGLSSFNSFELVYKKQLSENRFLRFRAGNLQIQYDDSTLPDTEVSLGLAVGVERRRALGSQVYFCHGLEGTASFGLVFGESEPAGAVGLGLGYVLGVQYDPEQPWFLNFETIPGARFLYDYDENIGFSLGFNSIAAVTFGLQF